MKLRPYLKREEAAFMNIPMGLIAILIASLVAAVPNAAAQDEPGRMDQAGREAFGLWQEKEQEREISEATRRYWDYWMSQSPSRYSAGRMWLKLEEVQRWLKDPSNNPPPPPPPPFWRSYGPRQRWGGGPPVGAPPPPSSRFWYDWYWYQDSFNTPPSSAYPPSHQDSRQEDSGK